MISLRWHHLSRRLERSVTNYHFSESMGEAGKEVLERETSEWQQAMSQPLLITRTDRNGRGVIVPRDVQNILNDVSLRANRFRILLRRPRLHANLQSTGHREAIQSVVDLSKDVIQLLVRVKEDNQNLGADSLPVALGTLFLAVAAWPTEFEWQCRDAVFMALQLVGGLSPDSCHIEIMSTVLQALREADDRLKLDMRVNRGAVPASSPAAGETAVDSTSAQNVDGLEDSPLKIAADLERLYNIVSCPDGPFCVATSSDADAAWARVREFFKIMDLLV